MLLAIDVGNTEITVGLFSGDSVTVQWRITTVAERTPDEWAAIFTSYLTNAGYSTHEVKSTIMASVSPNVAGPLIEGISRALNVDTHSVSPADDLGVKLLVDDPLSVGADRVVNSLAAFRIYGRDMIVVDFGTATTFDCVTAKGEFIGGVIAPGLKTASDQLVRRAAKLFVTELSVPEHVIGKRTEDCVRSGVLYGASESIDGIVRRIRAEWPGGGSPDVIATGGLARLIAPLSTEIREVVPDLTLQGLRLAAVTMKLWS